MRFGENPYLGALIKGQEMGLKEGIETAIILINASLCEAEDCECCTKMKTCISELEGKVDAF